MLAVLSLSLELPAQSLQAIPGGEASPAVSRTYEAVVQGMSCKQQTNGRMDCEYKVGKSLRFLISGVGQQDVVVNFFKVDADEDYSASVAPLHGCIAVKPARARSDTTSNLAFVSPHDGKIYRNWNTCLKTAKK